MMAEVMAEPKPDEVIEILDRAEDRLSRRFRNPSYEGVPLCLFLAFEPPRGIVPETFSAARLLALNAVDEALKSQGVKQMMIVWNDAPERTKEDVVGVVREAREIVLGGVGLLRSNPPVVGQFEL